MSHNPIVQNAHKYRMDWLHRAAWSLSHFGDALKAIVSEQRAIVELAIAHRIDAEITECFSTADNKVTRGFCSQIERELDESWDAFVARSSRKASEIAKSLLEDVEACREIQLSDTAELLVRLTWKSGSEWQQYFGDNQIKLHEGDCHEPEIGEDLRGIQYVFKYPGDYEFRGRLESGSEYRIQQHTSPDRKIGRRLFDLAESISKNFVQLSEEICEFTKGERKKILPEEETRPEIVSFRFTLGEDHETISILALLNDANPDNDPLYDFWKVELRNLKPIRML